MASSSPLTREPDNLKRLEDAGIGAIVLHSLFEEQAASCRPNYDIGAEAGPDAYMELIARAKSSVGVPVIASLNAASRKGWQGLARQMEQAGADALELNIHAIPGDPDLSGVTIESSCVEIVKAVRKETDLPLAVKLLPYFTNLANLATRLDAAGAGALVLFNRFYQNDIDLARGTWKSVVAPSTKAESLLPMHWLALLYGRVSSDLAATGAIRDADDALKMIMAGADVTMLCGVLLEKGLGEIRKIKKGIARWLEQHDCASLTPVRGLMSHFRWDNPGEIERHQYFRTVSSSAPPAAFAGK